MTAEIAHTDRAHSEIGASSAKRFLACPASVSLSRGKENKGSPFAEEGTAAHECSEYCFEHKVDAKSTIGMAFNTQYTQEDGTEGFIVDAEMAVHVQYYLDKMEIYTNEDSGYDVYIEQRFEMKKIHKEMFGSNDFCAFGIENGEMLIADFKYGAGVNVNAEENIQMIIYALGAYYEFQDIYNFKTVKLIIVQPRIEGCEWDEWTISIKELLVYEKMLKAGVKKVYSKNPPIASGDHCQFCNAKATCPELKAVAEDLTEMSFDAVPLDTPVLPEVPSMEINKIATVLAHQKAITEWMSSVKAHAKDLLERGHVVPGWKMVKGNSTRKLTSETELRLEFDDFFELDAPKKLKGIGALEAEIGKKEIAPYFTSYEGKNVIAKESDKREAIVPFTADDAFDEADEDFSDMEF